MPLNQPLNKQELSFLRNSLKADFLFPTIYQARSITLADLTIEADSDEVKIYGKNGFTKLNFQCNRQSIDDIDLLLDALKKAYSYIKRMRFVEQIILSCNADEMTIATASWLSSKDLNRTVLFNEKQQHLLISNMMDCIVYTMLLKAIRLRLNTIETTKSDDSIKPAQSVVNGFL